MNSVNRFFHVVLAFVPLLFSPALLFVLSEGWLDFGGGEKDIILVFPYAIWAIVFFLSALPLIVKKWSMNRWAVRAAVIATMVLFVLGLVAYVFSWLGVS